MKNYFIPGLASEKKARLQESAVDFCDFQVDGTAGVVVDEDALPRVLAILGAAMVAEHETSIEGIVRAVLGEDAYTTRPLVPPPPTRKFVVEVVDWNGNGQGGFKKIAEEVLVPAVRTDVVLSVPHGVAVAPASDGKFHVLIWSAPAGQIKDNYSTPNKIWGLGIDCRDSQWGVSSGQGVPIMDAETSWVVAELVDSNLYIHHDLCHSGTDRELSIFRRLCEEVALELSATPEERAERQRKLAEEKLKKSRAAYVQECSRRFEKTVQGTREAVSKGHADIARLQQELARRIRETHGAERKLEQIESLRVEQTASYGREFDSLIAVPGVERVEVSDGVIKVFTEHIYITPDKCADTYDIGKFRMEIYTSGSNGGIRFFNLTRQGTAGGTGYNTQHPHVNQSGSPCLGNIKEMVPTLIGEYEYSAVAQIGLQYLKSVNTEDSAGKGIFQFWPEKMEGKVV